MRKQLSHAALVLMAVAGLAACAPGGGSAPSPSSAAASPSAGTLSPDTETNSPAPSPSAAPLTSGPGQGNAELAIMVKPSDTGAPSNFTLVCQDGVPAAESQHPNAAAACAALKNNPAIVSFSPAKAQACTQQYGGPQQSTVTGVVDGRSVEANFSLRDGCEIAAWNAAKDVLGATGGAG
ncbi:MAG TPA: SSI family serine proteinase inhibitor [Arthrobacter sp.]|jgi:hypothetical protein|nr:SSI family serine proteinase inhibitor [Arthrobacter sp.]